VVVVEADVNQSCKINFITELKLSFTADNYLGQISIGVKVVDQAIYGISVVV
jgi:hypothetical protein